MNVGAKYARQYVRYSKDSVSADLELDARLKRRGLWQGNRPVTLWEWRWAQRKVAKAQTLGTDMTCGSKQFCKQMTNCEEVKFYLNEYGLSGLDGNNDGVPCETVCRWFLIVRVRSNSAFRSNIPTQNDTKGLLVNISFLPMNTNSRLTPFSNIGGYLRTFR